jgi:hypothetical protein
MQIKHIITIAILLGAFVLGNSYDAMKARLGSAVQEQEVVCKTSTSTSYALPANSSRIVLGTTTGNNLLWAEFTPTTGNDPIWLGINFGNVAAVNTGIRVSTGTEPTRIEGANLTFSQIQAISPGASSLTVTACYN